MVSFDRHARKLRKLCCILEYRLHAQEYARAKRRSTCQKRVAHGLRTADGVICAGIVR
jgi:hypothetical protein